MDKDINKVPSPEECKSTLVPIQDALYVLNGKWKLPVLIAIMEGNHRFGDIQKAIGIAPKILSHELKELELNSLVTRSVIDSTHAIVKYELTDYSVSLAPVVKALSDWGKQHRERIVAQMNGKKQQ